MPSPQPGSATRGTGLSTVVGLGTYSREMRPARAGRRQELLGLEALISDDYLAVEAGHQPKRHRNWCWEPRWSATAPSGWGFPAR